MPATGVKAGHKLRTIKACADQETPARTSTRMSWAACQKRAFLWDVLNCPCGGRRSVIAAIQDRAEITRFLRHLQLWRDADDIQAVHGPPDLLEPADEPGGDQWDGVDDLQPLDWVA